MNYVTISKIKFIFVLLSFFTVSFSSCADKRSNYKETVKLFIKYSEEKKIDKIYELLDPETKKEFTNQKSKLLRSDFQINKYNVKTIRRRNIDKKKKIHYVEILLNNGESGFLAVKEIKGKFYIHFEK